MTCAPWHLRTLQSHSPELTLSGRTENSPPRDSFSLKDPMRAHARAHACGIVLTGQVCVVQEELQSLDGIPEQPPEFEHGDVAGFLQEVDEQHQLLRVGWNLADLFCDVAVLITDAAGSRQPSLSSSETTSPRDPTMLNRRESYSQTRTTAGRVSTCRPSVGDVLTHATLRESRRNGNDIGRGLSPLPRATPHSNR